MKKILVVFSVLAFGALAQAEGGIGPAGCGLGNMVFGKDTQVLAATTNGSSGSQTFGITTGTSNCGSGETMARLNSFIEANQVALSNDVARGEGETIASLSEILGCKSTTQLGTTLKAGYTDLFSRPNVTSTELANGVQGAVLRDTQLRNSCGGV